METSNRDIPNELDESLETIELELALESQDLAENSFEECIEAALALAGGRLLFSLPDGGEPDASHVAAVEVGDGDDRRTLLVLLDKQGGSMRVERCGDAAGPIGALAADYADLELLLTK